MPNNLKHTLIAALLLLSTANAASLAVLEITIDNDEVDFTVEETKFLTDELRRQAARILPKNYTVLTREKIISLVPKTAENLNSVIDIGIVIKSDYVTRSFIGKLGNLFTLTVELYETSSTNLIGDFVKESTDLKGFLDAIRENAPDLFTKILQKEEPPIPATPAPENPPAIAIPEMSETPETANGTPSVAAVEIPTNIPPEKNKNSLWVAISLDVLGATALGLGIYNDKKAKEHYSEYKKQLADLPQEQWQYPEKKSAFEAKYDKVQKAEKMRNIFYATGGALLFGGVVVHIWF